MAAKAKQMLYTQEGYDLLVKELNERKTVNREKIKEAIATARRKIGESQFIEADLILDSVDQSGRNAEWNFLKACVMSQKHAYVDALKYANIACNMDPNNGEYRIFRDNLQDRGAGYGRQTTSQPGNAGCDMCDICSLLICLDCLCR